MDKNHLLFKKKFLQSLLLTATILIFLPSPRSYSDEKNRLIQSVFLIHKIVEKKDSTPEIEPGSGFLVDSRGYIITAKHVVDNAGKDNLVFIMPVEDHLMKFKGSVIWHDEKYDLSLIKIENLPPDIAEFDISYKNQSEGNRIIVFGYAKGQAVESVRNIEINAIKRKHLITYGEIYPGDSGGPATDIKYKVVGVCSVGKNRIVGGGGRMAESAFIPILAADKLLKNIPIKNHLKKGIDLIFEDGELNENEISRIKIDWKNSSNVQLLLCVDRIDRLHEEKNNRITPKKKEIIYHLWKEIHDRGETSIALMKFGTILTSDDIYRYSNIPIADLNRSFYRTSVEMEPLLSSKSNRENFRFTFGKYKELLNSDKFVANAGVNEEEVKENKFVSNLYKDAGNLSIYLAKYEEGNEKTKVLIEGNELFSQAIRYNRNDFTLYHAKAQIQTELGRYYLASGTLESGYMIAPTKVKENFIMNHDYVINLGIATAPDESTKMLFFDKKSSDILIKNYSTIDLN